MNMQIRYDMVLRVATLAALKTRGEEKDGQIAELQGGVTVDDGVQGRFRWDAESKALADDDSVVQADGVLRGRWLRIGAPARMPVTPEPSSGSIDVEQYSAADGTHRTVFTLTNARLPVTDAAASGSYGTLKLATLPKIAYAIQAIRQNYTGFVEGPDLTGGAGDAAFDIGVGSAAIAAAADGALTGTQDDIGPEIQVTLVGGAGTGKLLSISTVAIDGTSTGASFNLNWSGTAASIDASSYIDVTGTIEIVWSELASA